MLVPGSLKRGVILYKIVTRLIITEQTTHVKTNLSNNIWKQTEAKKKAVEPRVLRRYMTNRDRKFHDRLSNRSLRRNKCIGNVGWNPPWPLNQSPTRRSQISHKATANVHGFPVWSELRNDLEGRGKKARPSATEWQNQTQKWKRQTDKENGKGTKK